MKKQIISSVMCVAMCLTAAPSAAYADFSPNIADSMALENNVEAGDYNEHEFSSGTIKKIRFYTSGSQEGTLEYTGYGEIRLGDNYSYVCNDPKIVTRIVVKNEAANRTFVSLGNVHPYFSNVEEIVLPGTIKSVNFNAFNGNMQNVKEMNMPTFLEEIGNNAFRNIKITEVTLPSGVKKIGSYAFADCSDLKKAYFPLSITNIPYGCFHSSGLETFDFKYIENIYPNAFFRCNFEELVLPEGVKTIEYDAFGLNESLKTVVLPESITKIGNSAFNSDEISSITVKSKTCQIGDPTNSNCSPYDVFGSKEKHSDGTYNIVKCYYNSTAHTYCMKNGYHFELLDKPTGLLYGDANMDGAVTWSDVMAVLQYVANEDKYPLSDMGKINADCYNVGDGITGNDANAISDYLTGGTDWLPKPVKK